MPVAVKICGLNSAAAADAAARAGAEFGGLMFFSRSPRNLSFEAGAQLAALVELLRTAARIEIMPRLQEGRERTARKKKDA